MGRRESRSRTAATSRPPRTARCTPLKLVTCDSGKFTLQLVKKNVERQWKPGVTDNQVIKYDADPRQVDGDPNTDCGGPDGNDYLIQTFQINVAVQKGEYIAVRTAKLGTIHCSGDNMPHLLPGTCRGPGLPAPDHRRGAAECWCASSTDRPITTDGRVAARASPPVGSAPFRCRYHSAGRARRGTSGALYLQSAPAGLNSLPRPAPADAGGVIDVEDRVPRSGGS